MLSRYASAFVITMVLLITDAVLLPAAMPVISGCQIFPEDNIWNVAVDDMPVAKNSDNFVENMGSNSRLHPDFGSPYMENNLLMPIGIPYVVVSDTQPKVPIQFSYDDESDAGPYPIPPDAPIEGVPDWNPDAEGDRHVLVLESDNCILYETFDSWQSSDGSWSAGSGAVFDLKSNALRPDGWTSADAAGLPILAGLVRYEEVAAGEIHHAIRFTAERTRTEYVWPARHHAGSTSDSVFPPLGQRFRLKADFDISVFPEQMKVILRAMKKFGLILADNGSDWFISGTEDDRWDNDMLVEGFAQLKGSDFEAVDVSSLMVDKDSGQTAPAIKPPPPPPSGGSKNLTWLYLLLGVSTP